MESNQFKTLDLNIDDNHHKEFKENRVHDILYDSLDEDNKHNQRILYSRLYPKENLITENRNISILTEHLILTSAANVVPDIIQKLGVTCVISAAPELPAIPLKTNITYHRIDVMDSPNSHIGSFLDEAADLINKVSSTGGCCLVFCVAGVSRSATLCIAYLMKYHQLTLKEAYDYVKMRRPRIKPNCGFFKQLIEYEKDMFINGSVQMVFNEFVQMCIPDVYDNEYQVIRRINSKFKNRCRQ
ncbi:unnamed protein product [Ceutorhynchus assimilis]|uniref:Uncharacterized protein n=1 Tax=Ceutorhynchus assimilis TaxID=467358 RepID=A0A9N9QIU3_9CUCU|nr:unnamed protein product [Ceutorhynchus assimilis]